MSATAWTFSGRGIGLLLTSSRGSGPRIERLPTRDHAGAKESSSQPAPAAGGPLSPRGPGGLWSVQLSAGGYRGVLPVGNSGQRPALSAGPCLMSRSSGSARRRRRDYRWTSPFQQGRLGRAGASAQGTNHHRPQERTLAGNRRSDLPPVDSRRRPATPGPSSASGSMPRWCPRRIPLPASPLAIRFLRGAGSGLPEASSYASGSRVSSAVTSTLTPGPMVAATVSLRMNRPLADAGRTRFSSSTTAARFARSCSPVKDTFPIPT